MHTILRVGAAVLMLGGSVPCTANPITWNFGATLGSDIPELMGARAVLAWTFDPGEPNQCAPETGAGDYRNQSYRLTITPKQGNPIVYLGGGSLSSDKYFLGSCAHAGTYMELRGSFNGPTLASGAFINNFADSPSGFFWRQDMNGLFPVDEPNGLEMQLNWIYDGRHDLVYGEFTHMPEPRTWALCAMGVLWLVRRHRLALGRNSSSLV